MILSGTITIRFTYIWVILSDIIHRGVLVFLTATHIIPPGIALTGIMTVTGILHTDTLTGEVTGMDIMTGITVITMGIIILIIIHGITTEITMGHAGIYLQEGLLLQIQLTQEEQAQM